MDENWYCAVNGQTVGPISQDRLLRDLSLGKITPDVLVWKAGMNGWVALRSVPELFGAAHRAPPLPPPLPPQDPGAGAWGMGANRAPGAQGAGAPPRSGAPSRGPARSTARAASPQRAAGAAEPAYPFSRYAKKRASFWVLIACFLSPLILVMLMLGVYGEQIEAAREMGSADDVDAMYWLFFLALFLACLSPLYYTAAIIHRAWSAVQGYPGASTSPAAAVVLFVLPLVNLVGLFIAISGWAKCYGLLVDAFDLADAPPVGRGWFSWAPIFFVGLWIPVLDILALPCWVVSFGVVLWQMCRSINYFADKAREWA